MQGTNQLRSNHGTRQFQELFALDENQGQLASTHACRSSKRILEQANDRLKRANRDLGETAAFIAASLTTVTAVEAVINIAVKTINLPLHILQVAFDVYIVIFIVIFLWGALRTQNALRRRTQAEKDIDQAKQGIFTFCAGEPLPKLEE
jgi:Flp pilus assembly protein TadB